MIKVKSGFARSKNTEWSMSPIKRMVSNKNHDKSLMRQTASMSRYSFKPDYSLPKSYKLSEKDFLNLACVKKTHSDMLKYKPTIKSYRPITDKLSLHVRSDSRPNQGSQNLLQS